MKIIVDLKIAIDNSYEISRKQREKNIFKPASFKRIGIKRLFKYKAKIQTGFKIKD